MLKISTKCMYFLQVSIIAFMLSACSSLKITDEIVPSDGVQGITISKKSKSTQKFLIQQLYISSTIPQDFHLNQSRL
ncbi:MAG: hypothetical protein CM15mP127_09430 [Gammaproteobacteria bacterium]|nr:MAG: hypothetical protein CM15mP127_09430 [Gammaproteobacteria bacterium]